ncbi:MAG: hypothetical protein LC624_11850, partial [Halobacteriales archaeon]|nr:hypothetical protein [Halobacteriales archaeon]
MRAALALLLLLPLLAGCVASDAARQALRVDGSYDVRRLTSTPEEELQPAMSADGSTVAFVRLTAAGSDVLALDVASGRVTRLSPAGDRAITPTLSADGSEVAWVTQADGTSAIAVARSDGSGFHVLTKDRERNADPAMSPDGTQVAFVTTRWGNPELVLAQSDGSGERRLTQNAVPEFQPSFSGDGARLAYLSFSVAGTVFVTDAQGSAPRRVTEEGPNIAEPGLDRSGMSVAWVQGIEGFRDVYVERPDGGA